MASATHFFNYNEEIYCVQADLIGLCRTHLLRKLNERETASRKVEGESRFGRQVSENPPNIH
jgi:hypothetical protein